jgi:hypothetical protein
MNTEVHKSASIVVTKGAFLSSYNAIGLFDMNGVKDSRNIITGLKPVKIEGKNVRLITGGKCLAGKSPRGFIICYSDGTINRIPIETFKIINAWYLLQENTPPITSATPIYEEEDILICYSSDKKIKKIASSSIPGTRRLQTGSPIIFITQYNESDKNQYEYLLMIGSNGTYSLIDINDVPILSRNSQGVKSPYEGFDGTLFMIPLPGELLETERLFVGSTDSRDGQNYLTALNLSNLKIQSRNAKPKKLLLPESYTITGAEVLDVADKLSSVCIIGRNSTATINSNNFKKTYEPKRVYFSPLVITLI